MGENISTEAFQEFYAECEEIIARVSQYLTEIEQGKQTAHLIDSLYRDIHTLKGSSQLFNFSTIGHIAHAMEATLEPIRRKNTQLSVILIDNLLQCLDLISQIIKEKDHPNQPTPNNNRNVLNRISQLIQASTANFSTDFTLCRDTLFSIDESQRIQVDKHKETLDNKLIMELAEKYSTTNTVETPISSKEKESLSTFPQEASATIRVQVSLLDRLMNLVGEMVLVRNQVLQYSRTHEDFNFTNLSKKLDLVTTELQEDIMKTRMQPIGSILSKFNRLVRDLARELNKEIDFSIEGAETELDKTLIEAIKDPLTHIIRNSCDHGIESIEERNQRGKPSLGKIHVKSQQESGFAVIEISDDGKGLDSQRILKKAIQNNLIPEDKAASLTEREIYQLIFAPGFSTAEKVSSVSGRGVGMDVVKTNIEKIGGTIYLNSELNKGTTIQLKIPLTLAIIPALIIRSKNDRFAIPQVKLLELVRVEAQNPNQRLEFLQGKPVFRLRGNLLPLVALDEILEEHSTNTFLNGIQNNLESGINIVILSTDAGPFGLIVDEILDTADIVVKPLVKFFKTLLIYSGVTIMGDGEISLILDVAGIAQKLNLALHRKLSQTQGNAVEVKKVTKNTDSQELLSFSLNADGQFTIPLCLVQRLEEIPSDTIEFSGNQKVVQYRDAVLPIISLNEFFGFKSTQEPKEESSNTIYIIVVQKKNKFFGIEVNQIIDIIFSPNEIEEPIKETPGILGNLIIENEVVAVIDILDIIEIVSGQRNSKEISVERQVNDSFSAPKHPIQGIKILFAEDTPFFVKQVTKLLSGQNFKITHAPDGEEAIRILENSKPGDFDLILSDIEMPKINGFQFATKVRSMNQFSKIPMIALTTRVKESDIEQGFKAGFNRYLEKLRSDQLLDAIQSVLSEGK